MGQVAFEGWGWVMSFAFLISGLSSLGLLAFVMLAPPSRAIDIHILIGALGCFLLLMAFFTKGPGRHRR